MLFLYERHLKQNISFGITVPPSICISVQHTLNIYYYSKKSLSVLAERLFLLAYHRQSHRVKGLTSLNIHIHNKSNLDLH